LRRQAALLVKDPLPLIVLTPKSLLRHPFVASAPKDLAEGRWMKVIDDADAASRAADVRRVIFCTGKVAVDLLTSPHRAANPQVAICRVEQLYPLPINEIHATIESYRNAEEIVWVQEEPENMGAWEFVRPSLEGLAGARRMAVLARPRSSSPSEGSAARHAQTQEGLVARAFDTQKDARQAAKRQTAKTNK
jgi:2-oxoglutarate dehydrogenase E1 component